jgi:hypothetical protein
MVPAPNNMTRTASLPPRRRIVVSFVARTHQWYPTPNSNDPYVAMIRSTGSSKSNYSGVGSAEMSPVSLRMCRWRDRNESPMSDV